MGDYPLGYQLGKVACDLALKLGHKGTECQTSMLLGSWILQWNKPLKNAKKYNLQGLQAGLESGELHFAMYNVFCYACNIFSEGSSLNFIQQEIENKYWNLSLRYKNDLNNNILLGIRWVINTLNSNHKTNFGLYGQDFSEEVFVKSCEDNQIAMALAVYYTYKAQAHLVLNEEGKAYEKIQKAQSYAEAIFGFTTSLDLNFYTSLIYLKHFEKNHKAELIETVNTNQDQMKTWAKNCPENFLHKYKLVEAEQARIENEPFGKVYPLYKQAIKEAERHNYTQDAALGSELFADYLLSIDEEMFAKPYIRKAIQLYEKWGALAKLTQIREKYRNHLKDNAITPTLDRYSTRLIKTFSSTLSSVATRSKLDLDTILKANATLSQQVRLKDLIKEMLNLLMQNSGANKIAFLRKDTSGWFIEADSENNQELITQPKMFNKYHNLPRQIISYVMRKKELILLDDISQSTQFGKDPYIQEKGSKSVFVIPIKKREEILAILYLENDLSTKIFHKKGYRLINALVTQLAISMENTMLYENLESKVEVRNKELEKAYEETILMKEITQSIKYAKRIQEAVLGNPQKLTSNFKQGFVLFEPRDIVSGDFFWYSSVLVQVDGKQQTRKILIAADCTGHGIPGAFMTMMGHALLNEIIIERKITEPDLILQELDQKVIATLQKQDGGEETNDGMDISVLVLDETKAYFSGAKSPLWYVFDGIIREIKGSIYPVGSSQYHSPKVFTSHSIDLHKDMIIYMFSDGFQDQFGGERDKKYLRSHFRHFLFSISSHSLDKQKEILFQEFTAWKGNNPQTDDILVIGLKI